MAVANIYNFIVNVWSLSAHIYLSINMFTLILWVNVFTIGTDAAVFLSFLILVGTIISGLKLWI